MGESCCGAGGEELLQFSIRRDPPRGLLTEKCLSLPSALIQGGGGRDDQVHEPNVSNPPILEPVPGVLARRGELVN